MPFLPPNQQRQSTEGTTAISFNKISLIAVLNIHALLMCVCAIMFN